MCTLKVHLHKIFDLGFFLHQKYSPSLQFWPGSHLGWLILSSAPCGGKGGDPPVYWQAGGVDLHMLPLIHTHWAPRSVFIVELC